MPFRRKKKAGVRKIIYKQSNTDNLDKSYYRSLQPRLSCHGRDSSRSLRLKTMISQRTFLGIMILTAIILYICWWILGGYLYPTSDGDEQHHEKELCNCEAVRYNVCEEHFQDTRLYIQDKKQEDWNDLPVIYFVTFTDPFREQIPKLLKLGYTLQHVPRVHWIVLDNALCNGYLSDFLQRFHIPFTHLSNPLPNNFYYNCEPNGCEDKKAAVDWLHLRNINSGILYFGNDDYTYDLKLFHEIRSTIHVSMFPVGLANKNGVSGPVVRKGKVVGFLTSRKSIRRWPIDMAGFAINLSYLPTYFTAGSMFGYEREDYLLQRLALNLNIIEPKGNNCTEILAWRTRPRKNHKSYDLAFSYKYLDNRSNLGPLFKSLYEMGVVEISDHAGRSLNIGLNGTSVPLYTILDFISFD